MSPEMVQKMVMGESKTNCPKCAGHVAYPKELAGQTADCPHCGEPIFLPKQKPPIAWIVSAALASVIVCLVGLLIWESRSSKSATRSPAVERQFATSSSSQGQTGSRTQREMPDGPDDIQAMSNLCREFYNAVNNQDTRALQELISEPCRAILSLEDLKKFFEDGSKYEFTGLESARFQDVAGRKCAMAKVKRSVQNSTIGMQEGWRDFKFVKETGGWRLFRSEDIMDALVSRFIKSGFTDEVKSNIKTLRDGDPFKAWDRNDTNALVAVFKLIQGQTPIFPWEIQFAITSNKVDRFSVGFDFSLRNTSAQIWDSPFLEFELKSNGKTVLNGNALLRNVRPGQEVQSDASFFVKDALQDSVKFDLDVFYSLAGKQCPLAQNLPVDFKVQKPSEQVKFEVVRGSFDSVKTTSFDDMWAARLDYRVKNVSSQPVKDLNLKCVWSNLNGEMLDQSSDSVIGYGDVPLGAGQTKSGFIHCGKGNTRAKVPVKVDVYLESDERRSLVIKALLIR